MESIRPDFTHSRSGIKLSGRMLVVYLSTFLFVVVLFLLILTPKLYRDTLESARFSIDLIRDEFESHQNNMRAHLDFIARSDTIRYLLAISECTEREARVRLSLHNYTTLHEWLLMLAIQLPDSTVLKSFNFNDEAIFSDFTYNARYQQLTGRSSGQFFSPIYISRLGRESPLEYAVSYLSKLYDIDGQPHIFTIFMGLGSILRRNTVFMTGQIDGYMVIDQEGDLIITTEPSFLARINPEGLSRTHGDFVQRGSRYLYVNIVPSGWKVVAFISLATILAGMFPLFFIVVLLYLIAPLLHFSYQIMENARRERETSLVKYKLLTTQIDPHFVYNTMNIINVLARKTDHNAIIDVNTSLIRILQDRLSSKERVFDTISSELNTLKQYINIMNHRYKNNVTFSFHVDEKLGDTKIPKNMIQPFVENAFMHGLTTEDGILDGEIQIMIYRQNKCIVIEISDNGCGIEAERLALLMKNVSPENNAERVHIGIDNVRQRLQYIYNSDNVLCIKSTPGYGTTVILELPCSS